MLTNRKIPPLVYEVLQKRAKYAKKLSILQAILAFVFYLPLVGLYIYFLIDVLRIQDVSSILLGFGFASIFLLYPMLIFKPLLKISVHQPPKGTPPLEVEEFKEKLFSIVDEDLPYVFKKEDDMLVFYLDSKMSGSGAFSGTSYSDMEKKHYVKINTKRKEVIYKSVTKGKHSSTRMDHSGSGRFWAVGFDSVGYNFERHPSIFYNGGKFVQLNKCMNPYREVVLFPLIELTLHHGWTWRSAPFFWLR